MGDTGEALMIPIIVLIYMVLDYAMWPVFEALEGSWAIGRMAIIILVKLGLLAKMVSGDS